MSSPALAALAALPQAELKTIFESDPDRLSKLVLSHGPLRFDWSKTHLTDDLVDGFLKLAQEQDFTGRREALFAGEAVNNTEGRAAEHTAQRGVGNADSVALAKALHNRTRALIDAIEAEALGPIRHILHIGIGGSALGPDLIVDALGGDGMRYDVAIVSNVDGTALEKAMDAFDPDATLIAIASKTFTTSETMLNAASAINWMVEAGVEDPYGKVIALTAAPEKAMEWGVDETRILPLSLIHI